jgi:hypothetical protein
LSRVRHDVDSEAGGIQIHTPLIDQQGIGRLARAMSRAAARALLG